MIHRLCLCLALLSTPACLWAGAWPRAQGSSFLSTGLALLEPDGRAAQQEQTLYFERGLGRQYTLGFSGSFNGSSSGEGHVFLRLPPRTLPNGSLFAFEAGLGAKSTDAVTFDGFVKAGLSWSKGITLRGRSGWVSLDGAAYRDVSADDHRLKLDGTLGWQAGARVKLIGQAYLEATRSGESLTLAPSAAFTFGRGGLSVQFGLERKFGHGARSGLRLGIWTEF